jgi:holo-[acyl-carrier protein] synthase
MSDADILRKIIAKIGRVDAGQIGPDFSLESPAMKGSLKRAALAAAIRRDLGVNCPAAHTVRTFAELERAIHGGAASPATAPAPAQSASMHPGPLMPAMPRTIAGGAELRCGFDIEMISEMPEATDYREHEFYADSFSPEEIAYCVLQENPRMHFAARWCAKEALHKCDPAFRAEKMANVDVARKDSGEVFLRHRVNGSTTNLPHAVSLSHTNVFAAAVVVQAPGTSTPDDGGSPDLGEPLPRAGATPEGNKWEGLSTFGWMFAIALAILALIRTYK